ncbi:outer membrane beta-barrel protein [Pseudochryseolinea flava]|nr:OmpW family outer membrane protein [Pseudochryseolinea flava]
MKKTSILFFLGFLMISVAANAQELKKFRVGLGAGYASPSGSGAKGGVLFYLEPGYRISDMLLVNLRMEWAAMARGTVDASSSTADFDVSTSGSYTVNGQYYFKDASSGFRPFAGVGFGIYSIAAVSLEDASAGGSGNNIDLGKDESKFGFYPRVGFDAGHFQLSIDYNLVGKTSQETPIFEYNEQTDEYEQIGVAKSEFKNSYLGIRLGVTIGGGKK